VEDVPPPVLLALARKALEVERTIGRPPPPDALIEEDDEDGLRRPSPMNRWHSQAGAASRQDHAATAGARHVRDEGAVDGRLWNGGAQVPDTGD